MSNLHFATEVLPTTTREGKTLSKKLESKTTITERGIVGHLVEITNN